MGQKWIGHCILITLFLGCTADEAGLVTPSSATNDTTPHQNVFNLEFVWQTSGWSECEMQHSPICCSSCLKERNVYCARESDAVWVPARFCSGLERPKQVQICDLCPQDCVLTKWSGWSECTGSCANRKRFRTRQILVTAFSGGRPCNSTIEVKSCLKDDLCSVQDIPRFRWKIGEWTSCRPGSVMKSRTTGIRVREVACTKKHGKVVKKRFCRKALKGEEPLHYEPCILPIDCQLSKWTIWSPCSQTCYHSQTGGFGRQTRTRKVLQMPSNGGIGCPLLQDIQSCKNQSLERCPRHVWHYSEWSLCRLMDPSSHLCGPGTQVRAVYCTLEADEGRRRILEQECLEVNGVVPLKPTKQRACEVPCPQNCQVGEWGNWSPCSKSCGKGGVQSRTRPTLVPDMSGGKECPALVQTMECEPVECQWWFVGAWGKCRLSDGYTDCGPGEMMRLVYCQSANDERINNKYCAELEEPVTTETCTVPCPDDCVVSGWSAWSDCSKTCGVKGGTQSRTRRVLAYGNNNSICVRPDQLLEIRPCNQISCSMYTWQVSAWGKCDSNITATSIEFYRYLGILAANNGVQKRDVFCKTDTSEIALGALCDQDSKPDNEQICTLPVPQDCVVSEWSAWSSCSQTCGKSGHQMRVQLILVQSKNGGKPCPALANENGEIHEERFCQKQPPCPYYKWNVNKGWSVCYVPKTGCGRGYRTRKVVCKDRRHKADQGLCLENDGEPPAKQEKCFVPCAGDCELSPWSDFSPCSQSCGANPGSRVRTRKLANLDHFDNASTACPHIKQSDLEQPIPCGQGACPKFSWELGEWGSCILNSDDSTCGRGRQRRPYLCKKNNVQYVPRNQCEMDLGIQVTYMPCDIPCPEDCQISQWSAWSKCSAICGEGIMKRTRQVLRPPENSGRPCTRLNETTLCTARSCQEFIWAVTKWGNCNVKYNFICGEGHQERRVTCPAGERLEHECEARSPKPLVKQDCVIPCVGNCVMSPWSSFGSCGECTDANSMEGTKSRLRQVIREPSPIGHPCGKVLEEQPCSCYNYTLVAGNWTTCQPYNKSECGTGSQQRPVTCQRDDGITVPLKYCPKISFGTSMSCQIACPVDCKVGQHDLWSPCQECAKNYQTRSRPIIVYPNRYGRRCARKDQLKQNRTCNFEPCNLYTYNWYRGPWSECNIEGNGCGFGERHRMVECRRSDDAIVKNVHCLLKDMKHHSSFDMTALDLDTTQPCGNPCPMDCQVTPWSNFGPCYRNCSSDSAHGFKVRTRAIVKPAERGGQPCPKDLVHISQCGGNEMSCPSFQWIVNDWPGASSKGVFCVSQSGVRVHGGCMESRMPPARRDCSRLCPNFAECSTFSGSCECKPGFEGDGEMCFPVQGCQTNEHCPVNQSYCDQNQAECICENGKLPYRGLTCNYTWAMQSDLNAGPENEDLVWICLGVSIVLALMLIILVSVYFWRRNKQKRGELAIHRMVSNNLDIPKKVTNEYVPIHTLNRYKNAEAAEMNITENPLVRSYMQPSYKIRPRPGVSSSNFHLPINTDDLDDEVFTDNPAEIFMDPRHNLEDDVFMDSSLESRKSSSPPLTFMGSDSSKAKSSVSNHHARIGSDSSKGTDIYSSLRKAKKVVPPVPPTRGSDSSAGPPACTLGRKRFVLTSSEREDMEAMENAKPGSQSETIPDLSDSGSFEDPLDQEPSDLGESYLQFVKKRTPNQPCMSAETSPLKCSTPDKGKGYFMKGQECCPAPPSSPAVVDGDLNLSTILQTPDSSYFFLNDSSSG